LRRAALVALALALVAVVTAVLVGRGGSSGNDPVAHVGGRAITKSQLDAVVHHFRLAAQQEDKPFPTDGTPEERRVRNQLLGVLVYRAELRAAAQRLGIAVTNLQVLRRLKASAGSEEANPDSFAYESTEAQLLFEAIFREVTRGVKAPTRAELSAKRNDAMARFVARMKREAEVRYEPGYAPGS
jgi:hypothetical protein